MNAAEGAPTRRINDFKITKKFPAPPCLGEARRKGTSHLFKQFFIIPAKTTSVYSCSLGKFEDFSVKSKVRVLPWHHVADMDAPEHVRVQAFGQRAGIEVVHVLGDLHMRGNEGVKEEEVEVFKQSETFLRDVPVGVRGVSHPRPACLKDKPAGVRRGVFYQKRRNRDPEEIERHIRLHRVSFKVKEPECLAAVP